MGKVTRKRYGAEFKAKVAFEAIKGEQTLAELSAKHGIHQTMIAAWKRHAIEELAATFSGKAEAVQATGEAEVTRLHARIGQLVVELDFWRGSGEMVDEHEARFGQKGRTCHQWFIRGERPSGLCDQRYTCSLPCSRRAVRHLPLCFRN